LAPRAGPLKTLSYDGLVDAAMSGSENKPMLLDAYLGAGGAAEAEGILLEILQHQAEPLIRQIVRSKLAWGAAPANADIEDVCSEAVVSVISSLQRLRESPAAEPIADFRAFVAAIAYRSCSDHSRRKYPEFHRLRKRLRYILQTESDFALWQQTPGDWLCGLRRWQPVAGGPELAPARPDVAQLVDRMSDTHTGQPAPVLTAIFRLAGGPMHFDLLVRTVAECWGVTDHPQPVDVANLALADQAPLADVHLERDQWLATLWQEILELPPKQRTALLLNLRDESGACATTVFVATGAAGLDQIAAALEMPTEEFAELWRGMPLDDLQIAARLNITRQQVINLRKCAKERLARRLMRKSAW
jgi:RNA polymerase sigma factor (sigma-70 family)